jgi:hypothetical protein
VAAVWRGLCFSLAFRGEFTIVIIRRIEKLALVALLSMLSACGNEPEPRKADQSSYNNNIRQTTTSSGLSKADLAWHAQNTYGWDCAQVVSQGEMPSEGYFFIECSSGKKLRVYARPGQHPKISNESGGYN